MFVCVALLCCAVLCCAVLCCDVMCSVVLICSCMLYVRALCMYSRIVLVSCAREFAFECQWFACVYFLFLIFFHSLLLFVFAKIYVKVS